MRYPDFIKKGDIIGVTAPSAGITKEIDWLRLDNVKNNFKNMGYGYIETQNVRKDYNGVSDTDINRAKYFMELWDNDDVTSIIMATGGDFLMNILEYLDLDRIKNGKIKWIQGYSNITILSFVITTMLDIATIYGPNIKAFGMKDLYRNLRDSISIMEGKDIIQESFDKCEDINNWSERKKAIESYNLPINTKWKSLSGEEEISFTGRSIGGCMDDIMSLIGTKYDCVTKYIERYKEDGIIWFLEIYEMSTSQIMRSLWQMKNAGYFEHCKGIIFGRPLFIREEYNMSYKDALEESFKNIGLPVVYDVDIGHVAPQMSIVNGAILEVKYNNGKGTLRNIFR